MAGERLVDGVYVAINVEELPYGSLQGYSTALNPNIRWEGGELRRLSRCPQRGMVSL